jgi:hypothetical protein
MRAACGIFILLFFLFFSYHGLASYFTFDDGTTIYAALKLFDHSLARDLLDVATVFTKAFRPLTALFWRPLYAIFGFHPLPYRIVVHLLLTFNIWLVYLWARRLNASREVGAFAALIFCYNASMLDLFYNTCLVGDVTCFLFYGLAFIAYLRDRRLATIVCFLLALDSKEQAVTLPGMLLLYDVLFRRRELSKRWMLPAAMLAADLVYLRIKVSDMSQNPDYNPHVTAGWVLKNLAHYVEQLLYFPENSITILWAVAILSGALAAAFALRRREAIFGVLFFVATLIPIAVIQPRAGYAAYIPYFGMALTIGGLLAGVRTKLLGDRGPVPVFVAVALVIGWVHIVNRMPGIGYYEWSNPPIIALMDGFEQNIPEFPPGARILLTGDKWDPDWGPMFLVRLLYNDHSVWVDRPKNLGREPDPMAYDAVVNYTPPDVMLVPARLNRHISMPWEMRGTIAGVGQFLVSSPHANGAASRVTFKPDRVRKGERVTFSAPGLSSVAISAVYRFGGATRVLTDWCTLDANGSCGISTPPEAGELQVDWVQPAGRKWIFTSGLLVLTESGRP